MTTAKLHVTSGELVKEDEIERVNGELPEVIMFEKKPFKLYAIQDLGDSELAVYHEAPFVTWSSKDER